VSTAIIIAKIVASASPRARPGFHPAPATLIGFDKLAWNFFNKCLPAFGMHHRTDYLIEKMAEMFRGCLVLRSRFLALLPVRLARNRWKQRGPAN
jgi:hypothetical protein